LVRYAVLVVLGLRLVVYVGGGVCWCLLCKQAFSCGGGAQVPISVRVGASCSGYLGSAPACAIYVPWGGMNGGGWGQACL
jgi:hypothetical protein